MSIHRGQKKHFFRNFFLTPALARGLRGERRDHPPANLCSFCHLDPTVPRPFPDSIVCHMIRCTSRGLGARSISLIKFPSFVALVLVPFNISMAFDLASGRERCSRWSSFGLKSSAIAVLHVVVYTKGDTHQSSKS